jgi:hypothetical protein
MKRQESKTSPHEGYFFSTETDEKGNRFDNVVGRFIDHELVDNAATAAAEAEGKTGRVMRTVTILVERVIKDAAEQVSKDETPTRVTAKNQAALSARYPEAWEAYEDSKKPAKRPRARRVDAVGGADIVDLKTARG